MENSNNFRRFSTRKRKKPSKIIIKDGKDNHSCEDDPLSGAYKLKIEKLEKEVINILLDLKYVTKQD